MGKNKLIKVIWGDKVYKLVFLKLGRLYVIGEFCWEY